MFLFDLIYVFLDDIEFKGINEVVLKSKDGLKFYSWYVKVVVNKFMFLFFYGNGGNVVNREEKFW